MRVASRSSQPPDEPAMNTLATERYVDFHRRSLTDRDGFWAEQAALIDWQRPFEQVCDYSHPTFAKWFVGGTTNLCHNAIDRHLEDRADQNALIFVSTETDEERVYSYAEVHREVQRMAACLQALGAQPSACRSGRGRPA